MNLDNDDDIEESGEGWLVSYADMMTLIACFFILMMAFANYDPVGFSTKARKLATAFKGQYKSSNVKLQRITEEMSRHPKLKKMLKISKTDSELIITFSGSILFAAGQDQLSESLLPLVDTFVEIIRAQAKSYRILVEGHASSYEKRLLGDKLNLWVLSAARASYIASRFEFFGYQADHIVVLGKANAEPLFPEIDEKGNVNLEAAKQNQTVLIKVLEPKRKVKNIKFGFGIFFNDES
jgi:chemotaxis protein MotB